MKRVRHKGKDCRGTGKGGEVSSKRQHSRHPGTVGVQLFFSPVLCVSLSRNPGGLVACACCVNCEQFCFPNGTQGIVGTAPRPIYFRRVKRKLHLSNHFTTPACCNASKLCVRMCWVVYSRRRRTLFCPGVARPANQTSCVPCLAIFVKPTFGPCLQKQLGGKEWERGWVIRIRTF